MFKIKTNSEKLILFYWKYKERNVSQYIAIRWKNIAIYRNTVFLYRDTPSTNISTNMDTTNIFQFLAILSI